MKFPYGAGSVQKRRASFWAIYTDQDGRRLQVNTHTADLAAARVWLARKALEILKSRKQALEAILNESRHPAGAGRSRKPAADRASAQAHARGRQENPEGGKR